ncbi:uncharacterized protein [Physcomitrium patens]|uniref:Uncharacterized protein n=1 Tax=Physcomitrium patens TaxID=3218 RepID=A0A2K1K5N9_PHYPA|nr:uncharacterized protein LOC112285546 [Physcomitrium patens]PNR49095.1 hypothetical protein PHYPA_010991 [Physcomitrium patens]|eukprot:XP_024382220.1 uncharacterized protein LOC112285546 [Physcomitrella patens]
MENEVPVENHVDLDNAPLLGNLKRSSAMAALSPKDRQRMHAKSFKMPAPVTLLLQGGSPTKASMKPKLAPSPVKVPLNASPLNPSERYTSPTDSLVSPVTKGILARNSRPFRLLKPWGLSKDSGSISQGTIRSMKPVFTTIVEQ